MFGGFTGWLGAVALASAVQFCLLSHAATPDASLIFFTTLAFYFVWVGHANGRRWWFVPTAAACGFAVLAKGPVGLALPGLVVLSCFLLNREWRRLLDWQLVPALIAFLAVALPWYVLVTAETRGEYLRTFLEKENVGRFSSAQEDHSGPFFYYLLALLVMFAPWSCFLGATLWYGVQGARRPKGTELTTEQRASRLLILWFSIYLVFFSIAQTKLPNYIGPLYPAVAILTARFLTRWSSNAIAPARWLMPVGIAFVAVTGLAFSFGFLVLGGAVDLNVKGLRTFPGLEYWSPIGLLPVICAAVMAWGVRTERRNLVIQALVIAAVGLVGFTAAGPVLVVDRQKAAKELVLTSGANQPDRDIRLGSHAYFQESLVFYSQRRVEPLDSFDDVADFLATYHPAYLFIPEEVWTAVEPLVKVKTRIAARKYDFYKNKVIVVVAND